MKRMIFFAVLVSAWVLVVPVVSYSADAITTVTNHIVIDPADAAELSALRSKEAALVAEQRALEQKIFKVFRTLHVARESALKGDKELVELAREIARKQAELEKKTAEKYPEIGKQAQERDSLTKGHSALAEQLRDVRKRISVIQGLLPADEKPAAPVKKD